MFNILSIYNPILMYKTRNTNHSSQKQVVTRTRNMNTVLLLVFVMLAGHLVLSEETTIKSKEVDLEIITENIKENKGDEEISEEADDCESHILKRLGEYGLQIFLNLNLFLLQQLL